MNKTEQKEFERLKTLLALRYWPPIKPDLAPPEQSCVIVNGWLFNSYSGTVMKACTSCVSHNVGGWNKMTSQQARALYSSKELAYAAMMHEIYMDCARKMRQAEKGFEKIMLENDSLPANSF